MTKALSPTENTSWQIIELPQEDTSSLLQQLPEELLVTIFANLKVSQALNASTVCRQWHRIANDPVLWKLFLCRDLGYGLNSLASENNPQNLYRQKVAPHRNMIQGIYSEKEFGVKSKAFDCSCLYGRELFLGHSREGKITVWDVLKNVITKTLSDKEQKLSRDTEKMTALIPTEEGKLLSGIRDSSGQTKIAVWDLETKTCLMVIPGLPEQAFVRENKLISHSVDGHIQMWDIASGNCENTIEKTQESLPTCALLTRDQLLYGNGNAIEIWDMHGEILENNLEGHQSKVTSLAMTDEGHLVSGSESRDVCNGGEIKIWDLNTGKILKTFSGHEGSIISFALTQTRRLISLANNGEMKLWNLETECCETTFNVKVDKNHEWEKHSLALTQEGELIVKLPSSSEQVHCKIFDFSASHNAIFQELANILGHCERIPSTRGTSWKMSDNFKRYDTVLSRFLRMPASERAEIYLEFASVLGLYSNYTPGYPEAVFQGTTGCTGSPQQKAEAIGKYLLKKGIQQSSAWALPRCILT